MNLSRLFSFGHPLAVGQLVPSVKSVDQDGREADLLEASRRGVVLVYFYPKASTPGCTAQACSLRDSFGDIRARGVEVFGVSVDGPAAQKKFQDAFSLPFRLLADAEGRVAEAFGVGWMLGFTARQSFLLKEGRVIWTSHKARTKDHAAEVLQALDGLKR